VAHSVCTVAIKSEAFEKPTNANTQNIEGE